MKKSSINIFGSRAPESDEDTEPSVSGTLSTGDSFEDASDDSSPDANQHGEYDDETDGEHDSSSGEESEEDSREYERSRRRHSHASSSKHHRRHEEDESDSRSESPEKPRKKQSSKSSSSSLRREPSPPRKAKAPPPTTASTYKPPKKLDRAELYLDLSTKSDGHRRSEKSSSRRERSPPRSSKKSSHRRVARSLSPSVSESRSPSPRRSSKRDDDERRHKSSDRSRHESKERSKSRGGGRHESKDKRHRSSSSHSDRKSDEKPQKKQQSSSSSETAKPKRAQPAVKRPRKKPVIDPLVAITIEKDDKPHVKLAKMLLRVEDDLKKIPVKIPEFVELLARIEDEDEDLFNELLELGAELHEAGLILGLPSNSVFKFDSLYAFVEYQDDETETKTMEMRKCTELLAEGDIAFCQLPDELVNRNTLAKLMADRAPKRILDIINRKSFKGKVGYQVNYLVNKLAMELEPATPQLACTHICIEERVKPRSRQPDAFEEDKWTRAILGVDKVDTIVKYRLFNALPTAEEPVTRETVEACFKARDQIVEKLKAFIEEAPTGISMRKCDVEARENSDDEEADEQEEEMQVEEKKPKKSSTTASSASKKPPQTPAKKKPASEPQQSKKTTTKRKHSDEDESDHSSAGDASPKQRQSPESDAPPPPAKKVKKDAADVVAASKPPLSAKKPVADVLAEFNIKKSQVADPARAQLLGDLYRSNKEAKLNAIQRQMHVEKYAQAPITVGAAADDETQ
jgi:hypothetical protein